MGPARSFALVGGIAYLVLSAVELFVARPQEIVAGGRVVLNYSLLHNAIHWGIGIALLASLSFGRYPAKMAARAVGFAFVPISLLSIFATDWFGRLMGHGGPLPLLLVFSNLATCLVGLVAGYTSPATRGMVRHGRGTYQP